MRWAGTASVVFLFACRNRKPGLFCPGGERCFDFGLERDYFGQESRDVQTPGKNVKKLESEIHGVVFEQASAHGAEQINSHHAGNSSARA